jgi:hypothetical protein
MPCLLREVLYAKKEVGQLNLLARSHTCSSASQPFRSLERGSSALAATLKGIKPQSQTRGFAAFPRPPHCMLLSSSTVTHKLRILNWFVCVYFSSLVFIVFPC